MLADWPDNTSDKRDKEVAVLSKVVSMRLKEETWERLQRAARRLGRRPSEASALLLDEALKADEFAHIQFRSTPVGRQAHLTGTGLAVWEVMFMAKACNGEAERVAALLEVPLAKVQAALNYAAAYPDEIADALADADRGPDELRRLLSTLETVSVADL
jgi:uncharacterized protein (DUF433 family)